MQQDRASAGISYIDVADLAREVGREHHGDIHFELWMPMRGDTGIAFYARAVFVPRTIGIVSKRTQQFVARPWPSGEARTFAGLLYRGLLDLSGKLDDQANAELARSQDRLPGL